MLYSDTTWFSMSQLMILGLEEEHIYFVLLFGGIVVCYLLIQPFISFLVAMQSARVLSYILSSLLALVVLFVTILITNAQESSRLLMRVTLESLALFGILLVIVVRLKRFINNRRKRVLPNLSYLFLYHILCNEMLLFVRRFCGDQFILHKYEAVKSADVYS